MLVEGHSMGQTDHNRLLYCLQLHKALIVVQQAGHQCQKDIQQTSVNYKRFNVTAHLNIWTPRVLKI